MSGTGESTPLSHPNYTSSDSPGIKDQVTKVLNKENADKAATFAKVQMDKLSKMASDGDLSIRLLGLLGGLAMTVTSVLGLLGNVATFHVFSALIDLYTLLLGLLIIVLEGNKCPFPKFEENLYKYAMFLKFVWGRGCLYFIAGSLEASQMSIVELAVGGFMCFVGITYIIVGRATAKKLSHLRKSLYSEQILVTKFNEADIENKGSLDVNQFKILTQSLGMDLTKRELEVAFLRLDRDDDGQITYEDFMTWWTEWEYDSVETNQFDLAV